MSDNIRLLLKRGAKANTSNLSLMQGEIVYSVDTYELLVPRQDNTVPQKINVFQNVQTVSLGSSYTMKFEDDVLILKVPNDISITLSTPTKGKSVVVKCAGDGTHSVTLFPPMNTKLDGNSSMSIIADNSSVTLIGDGSDWYII
jgi:hypothetical protein